MDAIKEKSLPLAIGLNLFIPGLGYLYMGKWLIGIAGSAIIIGAYLTTPAIMAGQVWLVMNVIMAIDMFILSQKRKKEIIQDNSKKCPSCAELILKEAKVCRFCNAKV
jgi:uncharacterized membrane protein